MRWKPVLFVWPLGGGLFPLRCKGWVVVAAEDLGAPLCLQKPSLGHDMLAPPTPPLWVHLLNVAHPDSSQGLSVNQSSRCPLELPDGGRSSQRNSWPQHEEDIPEPAHIMGHMLCASRGRELSTPHFLSPSQRLKRGRGHPSPGL